MKNDPTTRFEIELPPERWRQVDELAIARGQRDRSLPVGGSGSDLKFNSVRFFGGLILRKTSPQNPQGFHPLHAFERLQ
jgi:hypothetical protein